MSVAHCLPQSSTDSSIRWIVLVIVVLVAAAWPGAAQVLGVAASAAVIVGWGERG